MSTRYQLWDKESQVITPIVEVLTAGQWMERYPAAAAIPYVLAAGEVNGAFCTPLGQMKQICAQQGCDFSAWTPSKPSRTRRTPPARRSPTRS